MTRKLALLIATLCLALFGFAYLWVVDPRIVLGVFIVMLAYHLAVMPDEMSGDA